MEDEMVKNCARLFDGDARKPLNKLSDLDPIFQILKESGDRDTGPTKHPHAAYALWVALDR